MSKSRESQRRAAVERMADHLLAEGLSAASLRPLAVAAGTSDRMLLYYFKDKDEILSVTLVLVADRLMAILDGARAEPMPFPMLLPRLAAVMRGSDIQPYLRLWLELAAVVARGEAGFQEVARRICDGFRDWIAAALVVEDESERIPVASLVLATLEGFALLDAIGGGSTIEGALEAIERGLGPVVQQPKKKGIRT